LNIKPTFFGSIPTRSKRENLEFFSPKIFWFSSDLKGVVSLKQCFSTKTAVRTVKFFWKNFATRNFFLKKSRDHWYCYHSVNVIKFAKSQITLYKVISSKQFGYCGQCFQYCRNPHEIWYNSMIEKPWSKASNTCKGK
jgi:hypothetical protein